MLSDHLRRVGHRRALELVVSGFLLMGLMVTAAPAWGAAPPEGVNQAASTPTPTRTPVARRLLTGQAAAPVKRAPTATPTPLDFSFHVDAYCITRKTQELRLVITAHGGQPPYTYYNDAVQLDKTTEGSVWYTHKAPAGNPVPFKLIVVDSAGQKYMQEFFYKTYLHCGF